ncbi:hypothetical protein [Microbacterium schleiferi]|uniref:hypothetical protein n=1 Tax=Microbacterium schleiferi TaxID=69362 RepID=UPI001D16FBAF|nr:hypothetical protein [Microbacterium schleiferi]MCC4267325.1 hypothetical protein [Microbacterium schleiferi]
MTEHEPTPIVETRLAPERTTPDWRRLEVVARRFEQPLQEGIARALANKTEIDEGTARCIAHTLGRALGPESRLAAFARDGEGSYFDLRDEYLDLYNAEEATPKVKELINWLGTYLVAAENRGSGVRPRDAAQPPSLDRILVRTRVTTSGHPTTIYVPGTLNSKDIETLVGGLEECAEFFGAAFRAYLSLPDVNAADNDLLDTFNENYAGSFDSYEDAAHFLSPLEDWEIELANWADDHGLPPDAVELHVDYVIQQTREAYDLIEEGGRLHAFGT